MSEFELLSGILELSEGVLKYKGEIVEFDDRLLFLVVTNPEHKTKVYPSVKHFGIQKEAQIAEVKGLTY